MSQKALRSTRVEARISPDALAVVKRAAEIQGRSVSDFVVAAAMAALGVAGAWQIVRLSLRELSVPRAAVAPAD